MSVPFNDLRLGWIAQSEEAKIVSNKILTSGYFIMGPYHDRFEIDLARYLGCSFALGVSSGTDALVIALRALGVEQSSTIVNVANAGGYTSIAAAEIGCKILYADVDVKTHLLTVDKLMELDLSQVDVVVVTHLYGNAAPIDEIVDFCRDRNIKVLEDCAQSLGGESSKGVKLGTVGDVGTTSFYPTKNLGAAGDGGAIFTNSEEIAKRVVSLRQYGWSTKYNVLRPGGTNSRLDELQAAILSIGLKSLDDRNEKRRLISQRYSNELAIYGIRILLGESDGSTTGHLSVMVLPGGLERKSLQEYLASAKVGTAIHYPILDTEQIGLKYLSPSPIISKAVSSQILSIPCFDGMLEEQVTYVIKTIERYMNAYK